MYVYVDVVAVTLILDNLITRKSISEFSDLEVEGEGIRLSLPEYLKKIYRFLIICFKLAYSYLKSNDNSS